MLCGIHRRKALLQANVPANVSASSASSAEEPFPSTSNGAEMVAAVACTWSGATAPDLLEENEKLRKENSHLRQEINQMKGLCNNIFTLMTKHAKRTENGLASTTVGRPTVISPEAPPDRREVKTEAEEEEEQEEEMVGGHSAEHEEEARSGDASPRLFGVSIRTSKRVRQETDRGAARKTRRRGNGEGDGGEGKWRGGAGAKRDGKGEGEGDHRGRGGRVGVEMEEEGEGEWRGGAEKEMERGSEEGENERR